ncbi:unnamed protein product, partial [Arabidopsis halleri]
PIKRVFPSNGCDMCQSFAPSELHLLSFPLTSLLESFPEISLLFPYIGRINVVKNGHHNLPLRLLLRTSR